jgi:hypothetical protein
MVAILSCLSLAGPALASGGGEPSPAQIRAAAEAFDLGREAYQREDFVSAAEQFERADSQAPSSTAIEYALRARDKARQLDRAATLAVLARERHASDVNIAKITAELLTRARRDLYELRVHCTEPCELAVGGKIVHGAPRLTRVVFLGAGTVSVRAGFEGDKSASKDVEATGGGQGEVSFEVPPDAAPVPAPAAPPAAPPAIVEPPPQKGSGWSPAVFWIGAGLTAAAGAATLWSGVDTLNNPGEARVSEECQRGDTSCGLYQDGLRSQRRTNVLIGVTAGLGAGTIVIGAFFTDWSGASRASQGRTVKLSKQRRAARVALEPWAEVGAGAVLGARGRF